MNMQSTMRPATFAEPSQIILDLVLRQVHSTATEGQEHAFLAAVGRVLAARFPLGDADTLPLLEEKVNDVWHMLDFGTATVTLSDDAVIIRHELPGSDGRHVGGGWRSAVPALVEGAYDAWLRAMGSGPRLKTTCIARTSDYVELRHGA